MKAKKTVQITLRMTDEMYQELLVEAGSAKDLPETIRQRLDESTVQAKAFESLQESMNVLLAIFKDHCLNHVPVEVRMKKIVAAFSDEKRIEEANEIRKSMEDRIQKFSSLGENK